VAKTLESLAVANTLLQEAYRLNLVLNARMLVDKFEQFVKAAESRGFKLDADMRYYKDMRATTTSAIHFKLATVPGGFLLNDYLRIAGGAAPVYAQPDVVAIARTTIMQGSW
jgi:phosphoribosylformylglycinamidine (FGAM) synthase-like amidotransferase family enzyme